MPSAAIQHGGRRALGRLTSVLVAAALPAMWGSTAWADGPAVEVSRWSTDVMDWRAPRECPQTHEVLTLLDDHTTWLSDTQLPNVIVWVSSSKGSSPWRARLQITWPTGVELRELQASDCAELAQMVAVVLALALDGAPVSPPPTPAPPPAPDPPPTPEPAVIQSAAPVAEPRLHRARLVGSVLTSTTGASWGAAVAYVYRMPAYAVEMAVEFHRLQPLRFAASPQTGADLWQMTGNPRGCRRLRPTSRPKLDFPLCLGGAIGVLRSVGVGVMEARPQTDLWLAVEAMPAIVWHGGSAWSTWLGVPVSVPLLHHRKHLESLGTIYETGVVSVGAQLGVEFGSP